MAETTLIVGNQPWTLTVPTERAIALHRAAFAAPTASPQQLVHDALEKPFGFEPLRRALTPDDCITVVIDPALPHVAEMLAEVLRHLQSAHVDPVAVTILSPPGSPQGWIDELPDEFEDVTAETHDPTDRKRLAYLATTKGGRRVYLNRTLVEADFNIVLTGRGYDPNSGHAGAENAIFPALSDEETRAAFAGEFTTGPLGALREEPAEVAWLLGTPFFVQVIAGEGDAVQDVVAGLLDSGSEGIRRQDARWRGQINEQADTVIASISGDPANITFTDLAQAAACAARVVKKGGRIGLLTTAAPALGPGAEFLRTLDGPTGARKLLAQQKPDDWAASALWVFAAKSASLFLASSYPDNVAEELFATPIHSQSEAQRLIDAGGTVLLIPDAHKMMVTGERPA
ncbi:MAG: lactate racemase domain-containing protein [Planctomycetia bacterium]|nr:lactate racemase domain-containing protein [Planctomycetia bacterium]